jgi:hypothetical protein
LLIGGGEPGIVEQQVDAAIAIRERRQRGFEVLWAAHVQHHRMEKVAKLGSERVEPVAAPAGADDLPALATNLRASAAPIPR